MAATSGIDPQTGIRGTSEYRLRMTEVMVRRALTALANGDERNVVPLRPSISAHPTRQPCPSPTPTVRATRLRRRSTGSR